MDGVKDSTWLNFSSSLDAIARNLARPKQRGVRGNGSQTSDGLYVTLRGDLASIVTSPLSQLERLDPIRNLSAIQIEAIRELYTLIDVGESMGNGLEMALMRVVKLLNPSSQFNGGDEEDGDDKKEGDDEEDSDDGDPTNEPTHGQRRSARLSKVVKRSYNEEDEDPDFWLEEDVADDDDETDIKEKEETDDSEIDGGHAQEQDFDEEFKASLYDDAGDAEEEDHTNIKEDEETCDDGQDEDDENDYYYPDNEVEDW